MDHAGAPELRDSFRGSDKAAGVRSAPLEATAHCSCDARAKPRRRQRLGWTHRLEELRPRSEVRAQPVAAPWADEEAVLLRAVVELREAVREAQDALDDTTGPARVDPRFDANAKGIGHNDSIA
jgi:hypothetical protein